MYIDSLVPLPCSLLDFLAKDSIIKMGRQLTAEVRMLARVPQAEFRGSLEIGTFCRERNAIENCFSSLADICVETTGCRLPDLTDFQLNGISSLDADSISVINRALCSLLVYRKIESMPVVGRKLFGVPEIGLDVAVFAHDTTLPAALGKISNVIQTVSRSHGSKVEINIAKVLVPGMMLNSEGLTLQDMGTPPFNITVAQDMLRTWTSANVDGIDVDQESLEGGIEQPAAFYSSDENDADAVPTNTINAEASVSSRYVICKLKQL
jgi:hypothetical protein